VLPVILCSDAKFDGVTAGDTERFMRTLKE